MTNVPILTSEGLKDSEPEIDEFHYQLVDGQKYLLTTGEMGWLEHVRGKYCIADHVLKHSEYHEEHEDQLVLTIDGEAMGYALSLDNGSCYKATMLSDDTVLQRIFFCSAVEPEPDILDQLLEDETDKWKEYI